MSDSILQKYLRRQIARAPITLTYPPTGGTVQTVTGTSAGISDKGVPRAAGLDTSRLRAIWTVARDWSPEPVEGGKITVGTEACRVVRAYHEAEQGALVLYVAAEQSAAE